MGENSASFYLKLNPFEFTRKRRKSIQKDSWHLLHAIIQTAAEAGIRLRDCDRALNLHKRSSALALFSTGFESHFVIFVRTFLLVSARRLHMNVL
jgi:hypothetical protein